MNAEDITTTDIEAALAPLEDARNSLSGRIGTLALIAIARIVRDTVPEAAYIDLAWIAGSNNIVASNDVALVDPLDLFYSTDGTRVRAPDQLSLSARLQRYWDLLDKAGISAWADLTSRHNNNDEMSDDTQRLDITAALALPVPPPLPALPAWIAVLETAVGSLSRPLTGEEAGQLARAIDHSSIAEELENVVFAVCGLLPDDADGDERN